MKILTLNSGSASLKFKLFDLPQEVVLVEGIIKKYDDLDLKLDYTLQNEQKTMLMPKESWEHRLDNIFNLLISLRQINSVAELNYVVHRVVHGGEEFALPTKIDDEIFKKIAEYNDLAPLHNPISLDLVRQISLNYPSLVQYCVFDTSYNLSVGEEYFLYGLPYEFYEKYKVRRYGFHGISHKYISSVIDNLKKGSKIISCHLGSGSSVAAIKDGLVVDNSFGFSPNENLIMATRSGDTDFDALVYLKSKLKISDIEIDNILNNQSGLLGISGYTKDMKRLLEDFHNNPKAKLAIDMYINKIVSYIGGFYLMLGGCDYLVFTGGIGSGSDVIRKMIIEKCNILNIMHEETKNIGKIDVNEIIDITLENSKTKILIIPTNEELQMAREVFSLINESV